MPRILLTDEWSLEIDEDFNRQVVDDCLVFWQSERLVMDPLDGQDDEDFDYERLPRRSIWILIYYLDEDPQATLAWIKSQLPANPDRVFTSNEDNLLRYAYLMPTGDPDREQWELTTFCITRSSFARIAYYFDDLEMLDWGLSVWKSTGYRSA